MLRVDMTPAAAVQTAGVFRLEDGPLGRHSALRNQLHEYFVKWSDSNFLFEDALIEDVLVRNRASQVRNHASDAGKISSIPIRLHR
jgi:hypothetical protein